MEIGKDWTERPSKITNWSKDIDYVMFVDEIGIYFNPKWNQGYDNTFSGLEIADLTSYPIHKYIRNNKKDKAFLALENKIDKYPDYINKGIKVFP